MCCPIHSKVNIENLLLLIENYCGFLLRLKVNIHQMFQLELFKQIRYEQLC